MSQLGVLPGTLPIPRLFTLGIVVPTTRDARVSLSASPCSSKSFASISGRNPRRLDCADLGRLWQRKTLSPGERFDKQEVDYILCMLLSNAGRDPVPKCNRQTGFDFSFGGDIMDAKQRHCITPFEDAVEHDSAERYRPRVRVQPDVTGNSLVDGFSGEVS